MNDKGPFLGLDREGGQLHADERAIVELYVVDPDETVVESALNRAGDEQALRAQSMAAALGRLGLAPAPQCLCAELIVEGKLCNYSTHIQFQCSAKED